MTTAADATNLAVRIDNSLARLDQAKELVRKRQHALDTLIAQSVSHEPTSPYWYLYPGPLTADQTMGAARLTENGLARAMLRYRQAVAPPTPAKRRRRRRKRT